MTEEEEALAYLREVAASIKFLNKKAQKEVYKRGLDVLSEVMALKKYALGLPVLLRLKLLKRDFSE